MTVPGSPARAIAFDAVSGRLLAATKNLDLVSWDVASGKVVSKVALATKERGDLSSIAVGADGTVAGQLSIVVNGLPSVAIKVWDGASGRERFSKTSGFTAGDSLSAYALSPDGKRLLLASVSNPAQSGALVPPKDLEPQEQGREASNSMLMASRSQI